MRDYDVIAQHVADTTRTAASAPRWTGLRAALAAAAALWRRLTGRRS
jgi:hypothetical protein